jgi:hypothetical protein
VCGVMCLLVCPAGAVPRHICNVDRPKPVSIYYSCYCCCCRPVLLLAACRAQHVSILLKNSASGITCEESWYTGCARGAILRRHLTTGRHWRRRGPIKCTRWLAIRWRIRLPTGGAATAVPAAGAQVELRGHHRHRQGQVKTTTHTHIWS